jgi:hypothetical protein
VCMHAYVVAMLFLSVSLLASSSAIATALISSLPPSLCLTLNVFSSIIIIIPQVGDGAA